jgi:hypothetical protein
MRKFQDTRGRTWLLAIHAPAIKRVRALLGVDLMEAAGSGLLTRMGMDVVLLVDVLYALCEPQAREMGVGDVEFGESLDGDAIDAATDAFLDELMGFFRKRPRLLLKRSLERGAQLMEMGLTKAGQALESGRLDEALALASTDGTPGASSTSAPASPASTPEI